MYVTVNDTRLYFDVDGQALVADGDVMRPRHTVILLHGGPGGDHSIYKPDFSPLTDHAQVIYLDHRGNGRSDPDAPENWNLAQWGDDIHAFCQTLGIHKPVILGTSFGGFAAQAYATRHPDHAAGLILVSTAAKFDFEEMFRAFGHLAGQEAEEIARAYWTAPDPDLRARYAATCLPHYTRNPNPPDWIKRIIWRDEVALHFNGVSNEMGRMDHRAGLARLHCPVLVLAGEQDPITPPGMSEVIARSLPPETSRLVRIDDAGHGIIADQPDRLFAEITEFLAKLPPALDRDGALVGA